MVAVFLTSKTAISTSREPFGKLIADSKAEKMELSNKRNEV